MMTVTTDPGTQRVLDAIAQERIVQTQLWGVQRHTFPNWIAILTEELGEAAEAVLKFTFPEADRSTLGPRELVDQIRTELVQLAAVATAVVEQIEWAWNTDPGPQDQG
jgi:NTP pyrophosphatase (non-canonical NTP hydrolase)